MAGNYQGRRGSAWTKLRDQVRARRAPCCRCGQPIDYTLTYRNPQTGKPDPDSFTVDHFPHPLSTHPHLATELSNLKAAHLSCNLQAGDRPTEPGLGTPSENW